MAGNGFDFLGFRLSRKYLYSFNRERTIVRPTRASLKSVMAKIDEVAVQAENQSIEEAMESLNLLLTGWPNYNSGIDSYRALANIQNHALNRFRKYLRRRHTKSRFGFSEYDWNYMLRIGFKPICTTS